MSNQLSNKFIWTGIVKDNDDPSCLNRVRVTFDSLIDGRSNQAILDSVPNTWENKKTKNDDNTDLLPEFKWSKIDPFLCLPFIPLFVNITPKIGESVNIIWPNMEYKYNEQYYIAGTKSSVLTIHNENSEASRLAATKGRIVDSKLLKNKETLEYYNKNTKGVFPEPDDVAIMGRGTCDIIVKNNDVLLRAGKSTTTPNNPNKEISVKKTRSFIQLSDFDIRIEDLGKVNDKILKQDVKYVTSLIEWEILNPENQHNNFNLLIQLYKLPQKSGYTTNRIQINTDVSTTDKLLVYRLLKGSLTKDDVVNLINEFISQANDGTFNFAGFARTELENQFPIVFRPEPTNYDWVKTTRNNGTAQYINISYVKDKVHFKTQKHGYGLISEKNKPGQSTSVKKTEQKNIKSKLESTTYNILGADKMLLLSHESRIPSKQTVILDNTTVAGISQSYIVDNVLPNTDPMVRGDELMKFLNLIVRFLIAHVHPYPGMPPVPQSLDGVQVSDILQQLQNASNTILNQNLRIN
jgi:hypothetical protein